MSGLSSSMFVKLRDSLKEICSLDDLTQRMRAYLSFDRCKEIFTAMNQAAKVCTAFVMCEFTLVDGQMTCVCNTFFLEGRLFLAHSV